ncbi:MAG: chlorite dismutase family protein [Chloroflexi bacterium]|nr:chlorite dismutase family protein [Chloroflexota bacterium]
MNPVRSNRQFVHYSFFKLDPGWHLLPTEVRGEGKREFLRVYSEASQGMSLLKSYSLVGIRGDVDFMLCKASEDLESLHTLGAHLLGTGLGKWLRTPYTYLAMTRESIYIQGHQHKGQEGTRTRLTHGDSRYLFVYPFVKTRQWYSLPIEERQRMMRTHFTVGHKFPSVKIHTAYSYGLDDQEFVLGFETESPADFLDLVIALRETEASRYTERDTPIFTCLRMELPTILDSLGS